MSAAQKVQPPVIEVVDRDMAAVLRTMTEGQRYEIALGLWRFARATIRRRGTSRLDAGPGLPRSDTQIAA